jgi:hypothetical protein
MNFLLIPILVGIFGWFILWALVKLLFYPIQPLVIGTIKWESLANQWIRKIDLTELIPQLSKNDSFESLKPVINEKLDDFFRHKLSEKLPMISMFIGDKTIEELKAVFMEELAIIFPILISQFSANLNKDLHQQWQERFSKIAYQRITKATMPLRWLVVGLGCIWGLVIAFIIA